MIFLLLPLAQKKMRINLYANRDLFGSFEKNTDTALNIRTWFSGAYSFKKENFIKENFTFRNLCVRINNEIENRLFNRTHEQGLVIGTNDYLFLSNHIDAYYGLDFAGKDTLTARFTKLKLLQDKLLKDSVILEVVFCPNKAAYFPKYIPKKEKRLSNYEYACMLCDSLKIDYIDFDKWFRIMRGKQYSKTGIHWSGYAALKAFDSLAKHIERRTGITLPHTVINSIAIQPSHGIDDDIGQGMNLLRPIKPDSIPYAKVSYTQGEKPTVLFIGDSYFWNWSDLAANTYTCNFKYYNHTLYPANTKELGKYKVIVLMATSINIADLFGYVDTKL